MKPYLGDSDLTLYQGDALEVLRELPDASMDCCVTSPPYWGLRDYGTGEWDGGDEGCDHVAPPIGGAQAGSLLSTLGPKQDGLGQDNAAWKATKNAQYRDVCGKCGARRVDRQLGLEATPDEYVAAIVNVFREVRRVLAPHGTCWVNLGDSYANDTKWGGTTGGKHVSALHGAAGGLGRDKRNTGLKGKDLVGVPWRVAFALQADGWWLRSDIIWSKPNPMPESVTDRPTKSHEYLFLLTRSPRYFFDQEAVREPAEWARWGAQNGAGKYAGENSGAAMIQSRTKMELQKKAEGSGRNVRSVWEIATQPYPDAHFATFPEELARRCILAGCPTGGVVLDPFAGSGTVGVVARKHERRSVLIELNEAYCELIRKRTQQLSLFA